MLGCLCTAPLILPPTVQRRILNGLQIIIIFYNRIIVAKVGDMRHIEVATFVDQHEIHYLLCVQVCKLLLESGADPRVTTRSDNTVLHYLAKVVIPKDLKTAKECKKLLVSVLQMLVDRGADVNCKNNTGVTPLHEAAFRGAVDVVNFLVKMREIDINSRTLGKIRCRAQ